MPSQFDTDGLNEHRVWSATIPLFEFGNELGLWKKPGSAEPELGGLAVAPGDDGHPRRDGRTQRRG